MKNWSPKNITFGLEDVDASIVGVIICEYDVVVPSSKAGCPRRSPEISMNLITKLLSWCSRLLILDWLPSHFCILTGLTYDQRSIINQLDSGDCVVAYEIVNCICRDMSEVSVECVDVTAPSIYQAFT